MFIPLLSMDTIMGEARYLAEDSKMGGCYLAEASLMEVANWTAGVNSLAADYCLEVECCLEARKTAEHYWMAEGCWKEAAMRMVAHCYSEARKKKEERCY